MDVTHRLFNLFQQWPTNFVQMIRGAVVLKFAWPPGPHGTDPLWCWRMSIIGF